MPWIPAAVGAVGAAYEGVKALTSDSTPDADDAAQQKVWDDEEAQKRDHDFQFGGNAGAAARQSSKYEGKGQDWMDQKAPGVDYGLGDQSRTSQRDALGLMQGAANGTAPSQAAILMRQGNDQAMANQQSLAAGARGPAALALAQQQAAGNVSAMSTTNQNNMGALRAQEMAQARGAYGNMATGMRGQDDSRSQYGSDLEMRQRALAQQGQMGYDQMGYNVNNAQLGAREAYRGAQDQHWATQMNADQASKQGTRDMIMGGVNAVASIGGAAVGAKSDVRVKDGVVLEGIAALKKTGGK